MLKTYGAAPYAAALKKLEMMIKEKQTSVNEKIGVKVRSSPEAIYLLLADSCLGIRNRPRATTPMGHRGRQTENVRGAAAAGREVHKDHPG